MTRPLWILETERLRLRRLLPEDLGSLYALYRNPEIRRYFPEGVLTLQEAREELEWFLNGHPEYPELGLWATLLKERGHKETGAFIGRCGLLPWTLEGRHEVEVAYLLGKEYWEKGLATEAAQAIAKYSFEVLGLKRLVCLINEENQALRRVAERIFGFAHTARRLTDFQFSVLVAGWACFHRRRFVSGQLGASIRRSR